MNIKMTDPVYHTLLAEAKQQNKPLARLINEILTTAAQIIDSGTTTTQRGETTRGTNEHNQKN